MIKVKIEPSRPKTYTLKTLDVGAFFMYENGLYIKKEFSTTCDIACWHVIDGSSIMESLYFTSHTKIELVDVEITAKLAE